MEVDPKYSALNYMATNDEEEIQDLTSKDIAVMKRRIANALEPGETVSLHFILNNQWFFFGLTTCSGLR